MTTLQSNEEFNRLLGTLIDLWCSQRKLAPLARILPAYTGNNGLTDGWADLRDALKSVRALGYEAFSETEWKTLDTLIRSADTALERR